MIIYVVYGVWTVLMCFHGQTFSQTTRCDTHLKYGGTCTDLRQVCPDGTLEYPPFSNYIGCNRVDQKCCAGNSQGQVRNQTGIDPYPQPAKNCGIGSLLPSSRILEGSLTGPCDWPFVVSIRALLSGFTELSYATTSHACQGVLISPEWVLTSPVCVISAGYTADEALTNILIVAGEYNVTGIDIDPETREQQEQLIRASRIYIHPEYKYRSQSEIVPFNDTKGINSNAVALIKLAEAIKGRCSGFACLPTRTEAANKCAAHNNCVFTGWGFSTESFQGGLKDELLMGLVRLTSNVACDFLTQKFGLTSSRPIGTICQSPAGRNVDSCLGDEGGAIMCAENDVWTVYGIIPFNMCLDGRFNLYSTDVRQYLGWIETTMASG